MNIYRKILQGLLLLTLATPVYFSHYFYYPFVTSKVLAYRLILFLALILAIIYIFTIKKIKQTITPAWWVFLGLITVSFIAAIAGVNFTRSFWSNFERADGILFLIYLFVYFNILIFNTKKLKDWHWLFRASIITSLAVIAYGLMQHFGLVSAISTTGARISSTLGNPSYLASYLLINFFFSLYLILNDKNLYWRLVYVLSLFLNFVVIYLTQTRGALIGLLGGLALLAILTIWRVGDNKIIKKASLGLLAVIILFVSSIFIFKNSDFIQQNDTLRRIVSISFNDYTTQTRLAAWGASLEAFKEKPIFGWGPENYGYAFSKYFPPEIYVNSGSRIWFDKAHSVFFEYLVTTGILGLLAYFGLLFLIIYYLFKTKRVSRLNSNIFISLLVGYTFANMFVFDTLSTYILFILILGFINNNVLDEEKYEKEITLTPIWMAGFILFFIIFSYWSYIINYSAIKQNKQVLMAEAYARENEVKTAYDFYTKALDYDIDFTHGEIARLLAVFVRNQANVLPDYEAAPMFDKAIEEIQVSINQDPNEIRHYYNLSQLYLNSTKYDASRADKLIDLGPKMIELAPARAHTYYQIGEAHVKKKEYNKALEVFKKAVELNPNVVDTHQNVYAVAILKGDTGLTTATKQKIIEINPDYFETEAYLLNFLILYRRIDNRSEIISTLEKLIKLNPTKTEYYSSLAIYYAEKQENPAAEEVISRLRGHDSELDIQIDEFIKKIKAGEFIK